MTRRIGIFDPYLTTRGGGEKVALALASALAEDPENLVEVVSYEDENLDDLQAYFNIDLSRVTHRAVSPETPLVKFLRLFRAPGRVINLFENRHLGRILRRPGYDVFVNNMYASDLPSPAPHGIYLCMFPHRLVTPAAGALRRTYESTMSWIERFALYGGHRSGIDTYQVVAANSHFTQHYISEYWGRDSEILYPMCEDLRRPGVQKRKMILHVGRFFENGKGAHHKRQDFLLETFAKLRELHDEGWELHFAGSVAESIGTLRFGFRLLANATGLPIVFHLDASFEELQRLYNEATIYWHATGFGSSIDLSPEKHEHFGISTVEAMSSGALPIVIDSAGQRETVVDGKNGFLWSTQQELIDTTLRVARMGQDELRPLVDAAVVSATSFNDAAFSARVRELFAGLGA